MRFSGVNWWRWPLAPFAALFGGLVEIRNWYYENHLLPSVKLPKPVISVGNLSVGGTGKTPVVRYLANWLNQRNLEVAILTRGYGRKGRETILLKPDSLDSYSPYQTGDEPRLLARELKRGVVVIDANRLRGAQMALSIRKPDVFLLDDAFQHRQIVRNIDILTVHASDLIMRQFMVPMGRLREPQTNIRRADLIWITRVDESGLSPEQVVKLVRKKSRKPVVLSHHAAVAVRSADRKQTIPFAELKNKRVVAFCGIGRGESFRKTLEASSAQIEKFKSFPDHFNYSKRVLDKLLEMREGCSADLILTTEKDIERLDQMAHPVMRFIHFLEIEIKLTSGKKELDACLNKVFF